ncbi:GNAT family N-acetyltransferase [Priestia megaterium]|uniref:GNAT family N-acetyltransferase n=1 Tax=Priestia megaterium TaxID=1404 RepID=UPI00204172F7|nr:GNAT family N-acetyltransferase [Priestia megaterium]MCM3184521.1 GNAT family N-acetyltransferase [Priestia megaterium]
MSWHVKKFDELSNRTLYEIMKERVSVFVVEQQCAYPEIDGKDYLCYHLFKEENGEIMAYLRIIPLGVSYEDAASIGRVFVKKEHRGQQLAQTLLEKGLEFLEDKLKEKRIRIQAQEYLKEFYGSFGFKAISEVYLEDNIPHIDMELIID